MTKRIGQLLLESARLKSLTHAKGTISAYSFAWKTFQSWCARAGRESLPASTETVVLYLTDIMSQGRKIVTANQRAAAINFHHAQQNYPQPAGEAVKALLRGARRDRAEAPRPKQAITLDLLRHICAVTLKARDPLGIRDHAMITFGFASSLRRSNLVQLALEDVTFAPQGLVVHVRREKCDQLGKGRYIGISRGRHPETCAVAAVERWLKVRGTEAGPLFVTVHGKSMRNLHPEAVCRAVKRAVASIDLERAPFGAHSLRSGFVSTALEKGVPETIICSQTGHRSLDSLKRYYQAASLFQADVSARIGM